MDAGIGSALKGASRTQADFIAFHLRPESARPYACPVCKYREGQRGGRALQPVGNGNRWRCSVCGKSGDAFDLAGIIEDTESRAEQLAAVAGWCGVLY